MVSVSHGLNKRNQRQVNQGVGGEVSSVPESLEVEAEWAGAGVGKGVGGREEEDELLGEVSGVWKGEW